MIGEEVFAWWNTKHGLQLTTMSDFEYSCIQVLWSLGRSATAKVQGSSCLPSERGWICVSLCIFLSSLVGLDGPVLTSTGQHRWRQVTRSRHLFPCPAPQPGRNKPRKRVVLELKVMTCNEFFYFEPRTLGLIQGPHLGIYKAIACWHNANRNLNY